MPPWLQQDRCQRQRGHHDAQAPVTSYVLTNAGLEAGVSLQGTKITKVVE
jgi:lipid-binding SYLF domain-containing protein